jgi:hypothetical protein
MESNDMNWGVVKQNFKNEVNTMLLNKGMASSYALCEFNTKSVSDLQVVAMFEDKQSANYSAITMAQNKMSNSYDEMLSYLQNQVDSLQHKVHRLTTDFESQQPSRNLINFYEVEHHLSEQDAMILALKQIESELKEVEYAYDFVEHEYNKLLNNPDSPDVIMWTILMVMHTCVVLD